MCSFEDNVGGKRFDVILVTIDEGAAEPTEWVNRRRTDDDYSSPF
jgi:hypothetical protein